MTTEDERVVTFNDEPLTNTRFEDSVRTGENTVAASLDETCPASAD